MAVYYRIGANQLHQYIFDLNFSTHHDQNTITFSVQRIFNRLINFYVSNN